MPAINSGNKINFSFPKQQCICGIKQMGDFFYSTHYLRKDKKWIERKGFL
jgi:hypothetical protein